MDESQGHPDERNAPGRRQLPVTAGETARYEIAPDWEVVPAEFWDTAQYPPSHHYAVPALYADASPPLWPAQPYAPLAKSRRRWPWVVAVLLLLAGACAAGGWGYHEHTVASANAASAKDWLATANRRQVALAAAAKKITNFRHLLAGTQTRLRKSQRSVARLETRQRALVNEKSQIEDQRTAAQQEASDLAAQRDALINVANAYIDCSDGMQSVIDFVSADDYPDAQSAYDTASSSCDSAQSELDAYNSEYGG
jgi:hypothetical protein